MAPQPDVLLQQGTGRRQQQQDCGTAKAGPHGLAPLKLAAEPPRSQPGLAPELPPPPPPQQQQPALRPMALLQALLQQQPGTPLRKQLAQQLDQRVDGRQLKRQLALLAAALPSGLPQRQQRQGDRPQKRPRLEQLAAELQQKEASALRACLGSQPLPPSPAQPADQQAPRLHSGDAQLLEQELLLRAASHQRQLAMLQSQQQRWCSAAQQALVAPQQPQQPQAQQPQPEAEQPDWVVQAAQQLPASLRWW